MTRPALVCPDILRSANRLRRQEFLTVHLRKMCGAEIVITKNFFFSIDDSEIKLAKRKATDDKNSTFVIHLSYFVYSIWSCTKSNIAWDDRTNLDRLGVRQFVTRCILVTISWHARDSFGVEHTKSNLVLQEASSSVAPENTKCDTRKICKIYPT